MNFKYNSDGICTYKSYGSSYNISYHLDGSMIIREIRSNLSNKIYYSYDESGKVIGFSYGSDDYYYGKNAQGDIVKIYNASGSEIVNYHMTHGVKFFQ